jgi:hypothetical protein
MSTLDKPEIASTQPYRGTKTEREPGTGRIITIYPDGRRVIGPAGPVTSPKPSK